MANTDRKLNHIWQELDRQATAIEGMAKGFREQTEAIKNYLVVPPEKVNLVMPQEIKIPQLYNELAKAIKDNNPNWEEFKQIMAAAKAVGIEESSLKAFAQTLVELLPPPTELPEKFQIEEITKAVEVFGKIKMVGATATDPIAVRITDGKKYIPLTELLNKIAVAAAQGTTRVMMGGALGQENELGELKMDKAPIDSVVYTQGNYTYVCEATPGVELTDARWRVKRVDSSVSGRVLTRYANGDAGFNKSAADLATVAAYNY